MKMYWPLFRRVHSSPIAFSLFKRRASWTQGEGPNYSKNLIALGIATAGGVIFAFVSKHGASSNKSVRYKCLTYLAIYSTPSVQHKWQSYIRNLKDCIIYQFDLINFHVLLFDHFSQLWYVLFFQFLHLRAMMRTNNKLKPHVTSQLRFESGHSGGRQEIVPSTAPPLLLTKCPTLRLVSILESFPPSRESQN